MKRREGFVHIIAVSLFMVVEVEQGKEGLDGPISLSPVTRTTNSQIRDARDRDNSSAITCPALVVNPHEGRRACASSSIMTATSISSSASNANTINNNIAVVAVVVLPEIPADTLLDGLRCRRRLETAFPPLSKGHFAFDAGIRGNIAYGWLSTRQSVPPKIFPLFPER